MLKHFISHRRQSSVFDQKWIGMPAMRKYAFASSANASPYTRRRLMTTGRPRRIRSETELIFRESTNLAAALRTFGMGRLKDCFFLRETSCDEATMFINPDIFSFDSA